MKISSKLAGSECFYKIAVDSSDCRHGSNETHYLLLCVKQVLTGMVTLLSSTPFLVPLMSTMSLNPCMASSWLLRDFQFVSLIPKRYTPLGIAIVFNHQEIALRLLDHTDIDVNKKTCESTALHYAALRNNVVLLEAICSKDEVQVVAPDIHYD